METQNTYHLPEIVLNSSEIKVDSTKIPIKHQKLSESILYLSSDFGHVVGIPDKNSLFLVLQDNTAKRLLLPVMQKRSGLLKILHTGQLLNDGFELIIEKGCLPENIYQVMLMSQLDGKYRLYPTDYQLNIRNLQMIR